MTRTKNVKKAPRAVRLRMRRTPKPQETSLQKQQNFPEEMKRLSDFGLSWDKESCIVAKTLKGLCLLDKGFIKCKLKYSAESNLLPVEF